MPGHVGERQEIRQQRRAVAVVVVRRPPGPDDADAAEALRHQPVQPLRPLRDACRIGAQIRHRCRNRIQPRAGKPRQAGQRAERRVVGRFLPAHELPRVRRDLPQQRLHLGAAGDRDVGAALRRPGDVAANWITSPKPWSAISSSVWSANGVPSHCGLSVGGISGAAPAMRKRHSYSSQPSCHSPRSSSASARTKCAPGRLGSIRSARCAQSRHSSIPAGGSG